MLQLSEIYIKITFSQFYKTVTDAVPNNKCLTWRLSLTDTQTRAHELKRRNLYILYKQISLFQVIVAMAQYIIFLE